MIIFSRKMPDFDPELNKQTIIKQVEYEIEIPRDHEAHHELHS